MEMFAIIADGIPWQDGDGNDTWPEFEVLALADDLERRRGYKDVEIVKVSDAAEN